MERTRARGWNAQNLAMLAVMIALVAWWGRLALGDVFAFATGQVDNGYILFAPAVAAYLAWLRRSRLQFLRYRPSMIGVLLIAAGLLASEWGDRNGVQVAWHGGVLVAMFGCVYSMTGWEVVRQFTPVIIAVFLMLPIPGRIRFELAAPAQEVSVATAHGILQLLGFEAVRSGNVITIDGEAVAVGEACNGMRMVFALGLVVYAFVFSVPFRTSTRLLLVALSPIVALFCNVVRLVPTSVAYGWFDPTTAEQIHDIGGWLMLPLALVMLMGVVKLLRWLDLPVMNWRLVPS